ncbi:lysophospholipid acyltransferase family protein [Luteococcus sp. OSA5]|uniref:lysophospholipid acyltransferase family protein n=1 Tax=Luteococcus sp. OSA5 TaxID=3401630 RepID=UPI003B436362
MTEPTPAPAPGSAPFPEPVEGASTSSAAGINSASFPEPDPSFPEPVEGASTSSAAEIGFTAARKAAMSLPRTDRVRTGAPLMDRLQPLLGALVRRVWKLQEHHAERVPTDGPVILAVNHVGILDGPMVVAITPHGQAMAKRELWGNAVLARVLDALGQIPIDRWNPDPGCLRQCIALLRAGRRLVIFPESHRGAGDFARFRRGAAYLALTTGAPVVPVALIGTAIGGTGLRSIPRPGMPVHVVYGLPVAVQAQEWPRTAGEVADLTERLRSVCAQHVQQAQQELGLELH